MKYIITKNHDLIIFSEGISHKDMSNAFGPAVSAGMINHRLEPYGESVSLNYMKPGERDQLIINNRFNIYE